jgi:deoxyribose-phosphate aldolase
LLKPDATQQDIMRFCAEARQWNFVSVCINPCWVRLAVEELSATSVRVCTVVGFPLGANETRTKIAEADTALAQGAKELDMVQNIGALRSRNYHLVYKEIADLADIAHASGAILKVILETSLLTDEEKERACRLAVDAKADFVKTSTGFSAAGATVEDITLMRNIVGDQLGVKASGGVRTLATLRNMVNAGASRIGTSSGVSILEELANSITENESPREQSGNLRGNSGSY